jgi:hypothetical protein
VPDDGKTYECCACGAALEPDKEEPGARIIIESLATAYIRSHIG